MISRIKRFVILLVIMVIVATTLTAVTALAQGPCQHVEGKPNQPSFCTGGEEGFFKQGWPVKWQGSS